MEKTLNPSKANSIWPKKIERLLLPATRAVSSDAAKNLS